MSTFSQASLIIQIQVFADTFGENCPKLSGSTYCGIGDLVATAVGRGRRHLEFESQTFLLKETSHMLKNPVVFICMQESSKHGLVCTGLWCYKPARFFTSLASCVYDPSAFVIPNKHLYLL